MVSGMIVRQLVSLSQSGSRGDGAHQTFLFLLPLRFIVGIQLHICQVFCAELNPSRNTLTDIARLF